MIAFEIAHFLKIIKDNNLDEHAIDRTMDTMTLAISPGRTVSMNTVVKNYRWLSHDPGDSLADRWGLNKCEMIISQMQNAVLNLDFVERRYRTTDPIYADDERRLRLGDINRLQEDGRQAQCGGLPQLSKNEKNGGGFPDRF
jgi:hypothetical protein